MERHPDAVDIEHAFVGKTADAGIGGQTVAQHPETFGGGEIRATAPGDVIAVRVGDDGTVHCSPGVDVEVADLAVKPAIGEAEKAQSRLTTPQ